MRTRIKIEPLSGTSSTILTGGYADADHNLVFMDSHGEIHRGEIPKGRKQFSFTIRPRSTYVFDLDLSDKAAQRRLVFWENHPSIEVSGKTNPNLQRPVFRLSNLKEVETMKNESIHRRYKIAQTILNSSETELDSVIFVLGGDPREMIDRGAKENFLIGSDFTSGRAMMFDTKFEAYTSISPEERRVHNYVHKAIKLGVIPMHDGVFVYAGRNVGRSAEEVLTYFLGDTEGFENGVVSGVNDLEDPIEPDKPQRGRKPSK